MTSRRGQVSVRMRVRVMQMRWGSRGRRSRDRRQPRWQMMHQWHRMTQRAHLRHVGRGGR